MLALVEQQRFVDTVCRLGYIASVCRAICLIVERLLYLSCFFSCSEQPLQPSHDSKVSEDRSVRSMMKELERELRFHLSMMNKLGLFLRATEFTWRLAHKVRAIGLLLFEATRLTLAASIRVGCSLSSHSFDRSDLAS